MNVSFIARAALLIVLLGACGGWSSSRAAPPTVSAQHAELQRHSAATAGAAAHSERERLGAHSVAARSPVHQKLTAQNVAGQRVERTSVVKERKALAKQSVASHAQRTAKTAGILSKH